VRAQAAGEALELAVDYAQASAELMLHDGADERRLNQGKLRVSELHLGGLRLRNAAARLRRASAGLELDLQGENVVGSAFIPDQATARQPLRLTLLGASGAWRLTAQGERTGLKATLYSRALDEMLADFGYRIGLQQGETRAAVELSWPPALPDFKLAAPRLAALQGHLELHIGKGQFLELDPGLGRMVGLFNIYSIARRLRLDFSDLFGSGLAFDRIDGRVRLAAGQATTDDLTLQGPSATIKITGRVGLLARDYDQTITVSPQLGSSLAIAVALAGGPAIGAAVLVAERLLKPGFDQVMAYQYRLTGPWAEPVISRVAAPPLSEGYSKR
jgi:uncharacterized protein YhdP